MGILQSNCKYVLNSTLFNQKISQEEPLLMNNHSIIKCSFQICLSSSISKCLIPSFNSRFSLALCNIEQKRAKYDAFDCKNQVTWIQENRLKILTLGKSCHFLPNFLKNWCLSQKDITRLGNPYKELFFA